MINQAIWNELKLIYYKKMNNILSNDDFQNLLNNLANRTEHDTNSNKDLKGLIWKENIKGEYLANDQYVDYKVSTLITRGSGKPACMTLTLSEMGSENILLNQTIENLNFAFQNKKRVLNSVANNFLTTITNQLTNRAIKKVRAISSGNDLSA